MQENRQDFENRERTEREELPIRRLQRRLYLQLMLNNAIELGCGQCVVLGSTAEEKLPAPAQEMQVFTLEEALLTDGDPRAWMKALLDMGFRRDRTAFIAFSELWYRQEEATMLRLIRCLAELLPEGSTLCMDYPIEYYDSLRLELMLAREGFRTCEHLTPKGMARDILPLFKEKIPIARQTATLLAVKK